MTRSQKQKLRDAAFDNLDIARKAFFQRDLGSLLGAKGYVRGLGEVARLLGEEGLAKELMDIYAEITHLAWEMGYPPSVEITGE